MRIAHLFIILFLAVSANAEFLALGENSISLQPCSIETRNLTVQNTGTNSASYTLSTEGEGAQFTTFSTISFNLDSGQSAVIPIFYTIPCTTEFDAYPLSIFFSDSLEEQELQQQIIVTINTLNVTTKATSIVSPPCKLSVFNFTLHNPSNITEIYKIDAEGRKDLALSEEETVLTPQTRKEITLSAEPQDCTESGNFPLEITYKAEKSKQTTYFGLEYIITPTDIPLLAEDINTIKTDYTDSTIDLTIQNIGDRRTQYALSIEGTTWASITPPQITLSPGEKKEAILRLTPPQDEISGKYEIVFLATVAETGIIYSKDIELILAQPTSFEQNQGLFAIVTVIVFAVLILFVVLVKYFKSESFRTRYARWKEKQAKAKAKKKEKLEKKKKEQEEQKKKEAEKQEKLKQKLKSQLEHEFRKDYRLVAHKDLFKASKRKKPTTGISFLIFAIIIALIASATWNYLAQNLQYVAGGIAVLVAVFLLITLKRHTSFTKHFRLLLPEQIVQLRIWKKGLMHLEITPLQATRKFVVHAQKRKTRVQPSQQIYQTFLLQENAEAKTIATFAIPKSFLKRNNASTENVRLGRFSNQAWKTIKLEKTGETKKLLFFRAEIKPGTYSLYLKGAKPIKSRTQSWVTGIIGLVLLALAVNNLYTPVVQGVIPPQTWKKDTVHQIDLALYFKDPDNDPLMFSATPTQNINIDITGNLATLTPEPGWTGFELTRFTADDGKSQITSNAIQLNVREQVVSKPLRISAFAILGIIGLALIIRAFTKLRTGKPSRQ